MAAGQAQMARELGEKTTNLENKKQPPKTPAKLYQTAVDFEALCKAKVDSALKDVERSEAAAVEAKKVWGQRKLELGEAER
eukprot:13872021-Alexandrium_andersonii.AAC.1